VPPGASPGSVPTVVLAVVLLPDVVVAVLLLFVDEVVLTATFAVAQYPSYSDNIPLTSSGQLSTDFPHPALTHEEMYAVADDASGLLQ